MLRIRACAFVAALAAVALAHESAHAGQTAIHVIFNCGLEIPGLEGLRPKVEVKIDGRIVTMVTRCSHKVIPVKPGTHKILVSAYNPIFPDIFDFHGPEYKIPEGQSVYFRAYHIGQKFYIDQVSSETGRAEIARLSR